jgi:hypothetical protein
VVVRIFVRFTGAGTAGGGEHAGGGGNGNARVSDGWHGAYVAGRNGAPGGIRESFGGKEAILSMESIGARQSVIATLHGKLTEADQRTLIKAGWWHLHAGLRRLQSGPQGDFLCRELPAHAGDSLFPGDGYFCVVAPGPYATTP